MVGEAIESNFDRNIERSALGPGGKDAMHFLGDDLVKGMGNIADGNFLPAAKNLAIGLFVKKLGPLVPKSLMDQMVLGAAQQGKGTRIIENLADPRFRGMEKWSYGEKSKAGRLSEVHYVRDPSTGELMDFKFKHSSGD